MLNEMPELKSGMVVSGKFKNDNGGREKYTGILLECDNSLFVVYANIDGKLKYISDIKNDEIDKISKIKRPSIFTVILSNDNLELIWERKPEVDWSKVAVDTKVLVRYSDSEQWGKRYFAKYENNIPFVFEDGCTSFTAGKTDNWFSEVRQIVLYEGNESLLEDQTKITLNKNVNINNMQCMQSACMEDLADYICELRGCGADRCQGCMFDDFGTGGDCKQNRLNWLKDKTMFI